jgi:hypothetical protein
LAWSFWWHRRSWTQFSISGNQLVVTE